jgi:tetratricopeptide (TPR) repeat protein
MRSPAIRAALAAALAVGAVLLPSGSLRAGLYNTAEPAHYPLPQSFPEFQSVRGDLMGVAVAQPGAPNRLRNHYLEQVAALEAKGRTGTLTVEDRVNLGAYYVRLLRFEEAVRVLSAAEAQEPDNFMVLGNLATANYLADPQDPARLDRAITEEEQALKAWPVVWAGLTADQLAWYRRAERVFLTLLQQRRQEVRLQPGRPPQTLDDLFHVRFVGRSGEYEPGTLAADQTDALPIERVPLVSQLLLWLPFDNRLYWLLAELLNSQGDIESAVKIMDVLVATNFNTPELWAHRKVLRQALPVAQELGGERGPVTKEWLLWALAPRQPGLAPGAGPLLHEVGWAAAFERLRGTDTLAPAPVAASPGGRTATADTAAPADKGQPASWMPDWRPFVVGLATGVVLTVLAGLQFRQSRVRARKGVG